jgi:hypothetical protein
MAILISQRIIDENVNDAYENLLASGRIAGRGTN